MMNAYEELSGEEQAQVTQAIQLLHKQTFLLERKYDRKTGRFQTNRDFYRCSRYLEFIRWYFGVMGIEVVENSQLGVIYIQGEQIIGDKIPRLATLYILILKLIYDEQMETVSTSAHVFTTLSQMHEKLSAYRLLSRQPSVTEIRRALALLKRYQIIEPADVLEDLDGQSRMVIYPCIHMVLFGDDIRALLKAFQDGGDADGDSPAKERQTEGGLTGEDPAEDDQEGGEEDDEYENEI